MKYVLETYDIRELGQRDNQEDALFPNYGQSTTRDRLFIVCDGMGGHSSGEVASSTVCDTMSRSIQESCPDPEGSFGYEDFIKAQSAALDELDKKDDGAYKKMGTTMTLLKLHSQGCTVAHIGDSRVYHIRPGKRQADTLIVHQTSDHSLVNTLVKIGELTPEEAKKSNMRNVITQAMQPGVKRQHIKADIYETADIQPGDYFMLCTDGILEEMDDITIMQVFSDEIPTAQEKRDKIKELTANNKDNHTAIIVHITDVIDPIEIPSKKEATNAECGKAQLASPVQEQPCQRTTTKRHTLLAILAIIATILLAILAAKAFL